MKNIIKDTRDIQIAVKTVFLRPPMEIFVQERMDEIIKHKANLKKLMKQGNIPAMIHWVIFNQIMIWNKLKEK